MGSPLNYIALLNTINDWLVCMEKRHDVGTVVFDFSKAFDSVPHLALLAKLRHIGLSQDLITWIHNYLSKRSHCVVVNGATSERVPVLVDGTSKVYLRGISTH